MKTYLVLFMIGMGACHSTRPVPSSTGSPRPPALVYKTKADYSDKVPVILNEAKTVIVSYPDPRDLKNADGFLKPVVLKNGYLLDLKGINQQVAFLSMSYENYSALEKAPSMDELEKMIIDRDPLVELCNCGNHIPVENAVKEINRMIRKGTLHSACKTLVDKVE